MSRIEHSGARYSHTSPPEWDGLVDFARTELDTGQPLVESARAVVDAIEAAVPDNEALEANRYHGLGLAICRVAIELRQPGVRERIVERVGDSIFRHSLQESNSRRGVIPQNVISTVTSPPFRELIQNATEGLSPEIGLLVNSLIHVKYKREVYEQQLIPAMVDVIRPIDEVVENDLVGTMLGDSITGGATGVFMVALRRRYWYLVGQGKMQVSTDSSEYPTIADILKHGGLGPLSLRSNGHHAANMREDEFLLGHNQGEYTQVDTEGNVIFRRDRLPHKNALTPPTATAEDIGHILLHAQRYGCPALHVKGMIGMILDIIPEAVEVADRKILSSDGLS